MTSSYSQGEKATAPTGELGSVPTIEADQKSDSIAPPSGSKKVASQSPGASRIWAAVPRPFNIVWEELLSPPTLNTEWGFAR